MNHFPHRLSWPAITVAGATPVLGAASDVLWGRPVFKAPQLSEPVFAEQPLFAALRPTRVAASRRDKSP